MSHLGNFKPDGEVKRLFEEFAKNHKTLSTAMEQVTKTVSGFAGSLDSLKTRLDSVQGQIDKVSRKQEVYTQGGSRPPHVPTAASKAAPPQGSAARWKNDSPKEENSKEKIQQGYQQPAPEYQQPTHPQHDYRHAPQYPQYPPQYQPMPYPPQWGYPPQGCGRCGKGQTSSDNSTEKVSILKKMIVKITFMLSLISACLFALFTVFFLMMLFPAVPVILTPLLAVLAPPGMVLLYLYLTKEKNFFNFKARPA